jgi:hypothetical protein
MAQMALITVLFAISGKKIQSMEDCTAMKG